MRVYKDAMKISNQLKDLGHISYKYIKMISRYNCTLKNPQVCQRKSGKFASTKRSLPGRPRRWSRAPPSCRGAPRRPRPASCRPPSAVIRTAGEDPYKRLPDSINYNTYK